MFWYTNQRTNIQKKSPSGGLKKTVENLTYEGRLRKGTLLSKKELGEYIISSTSTTVIFYICAYTLIYI